MSNWLGSAVNSMLRYVPFAGSSSGLFGTVSRMFKLPIAGVSVNEQTALTYSAVWRCVDAISGALMVLPFRVHAQQDNRRVLQSDHSVDWVIHRQANPEMSARVLRQTLTNHAITWGNGYAEIELNNAGEVIALWVITPDRVTPKRDANGVLYYEVRHDTGGTVDIPADRMLHIKGPSFDGVVGYNIIQLAQEAISMGLAVEQFGAAFFGNGATLGTIITTPDKITDKNVVKNLKRTFDRSHKGSGRSHKTEVLDGGMDVKSLGIPPEQAQFLETRKFQIDEIARWFGVPLSKVMNGDFKFKNMEQLNISFVNDCLMFWIVRWEDEVDIKLLGRTKQGLHSKMNVKGMLRGDQAARREWYKIMFNMGCYSINDILTREDENPIGPEGDIRMVPLNMATLAEAVKFGTTARGAGASVKQIAAPLFSDAMLRMARKESKVLINLAKKSSDSADYRQRLIEFYGHHAEQVIEALAPTVSAVAALQGVTPVTIGEVVTADVASYCARGIDGAVTAYDVSGVDAYAVSRETTANDTAMRWLEKHLITEGKLNGNGSVAA